MQSLKKKKMSKANAFKLNVRALQAWPVPFWFDFLIFFFIIFFAFLLIIFIH